MLVHRTKKLHVSSTSVGSLLVNRVDPDRQLLQELADQGLLCLQKC